MTMHVKDVMTRLPYTIDREAPVATAVAVMRDKSVRHLPVVDDAGRLLGMVSDRDLRDAVFAPRGTSPESLVDVF
ncbi:MAG: CBS domain-containing protein, partial [candidate division NC10 bacterium]